MLRDCFRCSWVPPRPPFPMCYEQLACQEAHHPPSLENLFSLGGYRPCSLHPQPRPQGQSATWEVVTQDQNAENKLLSSCSMCRGQGWGTGVVLSAPYLPVVCAKATLHLRPHFGTILSSVLLSSVPCRLFLESISSINQVLLNHCLWLCS